jgi:MoaA/NifB/PqqE/SkfB family radical SAM enzyme
MQFQKDFESRFIAESPGKLKNIVTYYRAIQGLCDFPYKKCNSPWVSAVIEPDGSVKPCFFHPAIGNIKKNSLQEIINGERGIQFRRELDIDLNPVCKRCVCYLNLPPGMNPAGTN